MMLRTLAVLGLSTATVTATMASVKTTTGAISVDRPGGPASSDLQAIDEIRVPALEFGRMPMPEDPEPAPMMRLRKHSSGSLTLPVAKNSGALVATGRILIKFQNEIGARCDLHPSTNLYSVAGADLSEAIEILEQHNATIQQFVHKSPGELAAIQAKAAAHSGRPQPDLASMMIVDFPTPITPQALLMLGRSLNDLDVVEYLEFEVPMVPAGGAPTDTPDFVSGPWGTNPVPPAVFPTFNTDSIQQYTGTGPSLFTLADVDPDDPASWFAATGWEFAQGYGLPWMTRLAGQSWRRYGSPPSDNPAFNVGTGPSAGFFGSLPSPTKVWLYGAEFEIVDLTECEAGLTDYDCAECFIVDATDNAIKDSNNPFPEFATDTLNPQIYTNIKLCPTGRITEIGIVDYAVFAQHEEFLFDRFGNLLAPEDRRLLVEEGQSMVYLSLDETWRPEASHGTATSGVLVAGNNDFGLTGMTWASRVRFYPSISVEEGARLSTAIANAVADLDAGSVLCIPIQTGQDGADPGDTNAESGSWANIDPAPITPFGPFPNGLGGGQYCSSNGLYALLIAAATDSGIVVVQAAGNSGSALEPEPVAEGASTGSIIVTGATPSGFQDTANFPASLWGTIVILNEDGDPVDDQRTFPLGGQTRWAGSNYFSDGGEGPLGSVVSGWAMGVPSLGYGDLYRNPIPPLGVDPADIDPLEREFLRTYTGPRPIGATFGGPDADVLVGYEFGDANAQGLGTVFQGTSCAAPQIAGLAAWLQGFGEMFYGTSLSGSQLLTAMGAPGAIDQMANFGESIPDAEGRTYGGASPPPLGGPNNASSDIGNGSTIALIPSVPSGPVAAINVIRNIGQGWSGSLEVYWGTRIRGTGFSIGERNDGNALEIRSEFAAQGPGAGGLTYLVSGQTTDFGISVKSQVPGDEILSMSVQAFRRTTTSVVVEIPFARNFVTERFVPLGVELMPTAYEEANYAFEGLASTFSDYLDDQQNIDIRFYSVGLGFITGSTYVVRYDEITLIQNEDNAPL